MRSRIHQLLPYDQVDFSSYKQVFCCDEAAIRAEMLRVQNRGVRWIDGTQANRGDAAVCTLQSENPRFNKPAVPIAVGAGLLPAAIEQTVEGMQVGEVRTALADGVRVTIQLRSVKNKNLPELTDALIAASNLEGVQTVEDYRGLLAKRQREEKAVHVSYDAAQYIMRTVLQETEFILFKEDWDYVADLELARNAELCRQDGLDMKTMTAADFAGRIPVSCYDGVVSLVKTNAWRTLRNYLLGKLYAEAEGFAPNRESYERYIAAYCRQWRVSEADARRSNTYDYYMIIEYASYFVNKVNAYARDNIFVEE